MKTKTNNVEILIVDNNPGQIVKLESMLKKNNYKVLVANNGVEALNIIENRKPTLIISNINIPEMDGFRLCKNIKSDETLKDIPVILLTALSEPEEIINGLANGFENVPIKPYNYEIIFSSINNILENRIKRPSNVSEKGIEILFAGKNHLVKFDCFKILDFLISTKDVAIQKSQELKDANKELKRMHDKLMILNDILEQKVEERTKRIHQLNSIIRAVRSINQLLSKEKDCNRLLKRTCESFNVIEGFRHAWIVHLDDAGKYVCAEEYGLGNKFKPIDTLLKSDKLPGCAEKALGQTEIVLINKNSLCMNCFDGGYKCESGTMSIRLEYDKKVYGVLSILLLIDEINSDDVQNLLHEVAGDIAFGLYNMELEKKKKETDEELRKKTYNLWKRINELNCLYSISSLSEIKNITIEKFLQGVVELIPPGWQYPENTCVRIVLDKKEYISNNFKKTRWKQTCDIIVQQEKIGELEVYYREKKPKCDEGPFTKEERYLITSIAQRIGDVYYRKRTESELLYERKFFDTLLDNIPDSIYFKDKKTRFIRVSKSLADFFNSSPENMIGKTDMDFFEEEIALEKVKDDNGVINTGKPLINLLEKDITKDGKERWISTTKQPWLDNDNNIIGMYGISRDITELKHAKEKVEDYSENLELMVKERTNELNCVLNDTEETRDKIDSIIKSVADGLIVTDRNNNITLMNVSAEELLGVRFSEVFERPIEYAIEEKTLREKLVNVFNKKKTNYQFDFKLKSDDPKKNRILNAHTSIIHNKEGEKTGIVITIHDVTHIREVDRMKTEFISTAAHELRTPLTSIIGFSKIMTTKENLSNEERNRFLAYITNQGMKLSNIVSDLLDISRIESGKGFSLEKQNTDICELISDIIPYFQEISLEHEFVVVIPDEPVELNIDKEKIEQVFKNILSNAIKYSPDGGEISVIGEIMENEFMITIEDHGLGMSPDQVERVFDKFYRADSTDSAPEGTGLGMVIVKHIVEVHNGRVWVESELGKKTTVIFTIPIPK